MRLPAKLSPDIWFGAMAIVLCLIVLPDTYHLPPAIGENLGPAFFPSVLIGLLCLLALILIARSWRRPSREGPTSKSETSLWRPIALAVWMSLYVAVLPVVGYYLATGFMLAGILYLFQTRSWVLYVVAIGGFLLFAFLVFDLTLGVLLPRSSLAYS